MAKIAHPLDDPPTASSSSDNDELDSSPSSSSLDSPSEEPIAIPGKPEPGSETETDSDSEPETTSDKQIAVAITNLKKTQPLTLALPATTKKRPRPPNDPCSSSKRAFQRLWSEEDEIALLQGMVDFKTNTGKIPYEDTNGFYEFMKKSISVEVSKSQFMDKIRSLKKYTGKGKNGNGVVFSKPHDLKSLALSKFIWGPDGMGMESAKSNGVSKKVKKVELFSNGVEEEMEDGWFEDSFLVGKIVGFGLDEGTVKGKWREVDVEGKKKVEEKMKGLRVKEIEYVLQKTKFLHEVTAMIAEALSKQ